MEVLEGEGVSLLGDVMLGVIRLKAFVVMNAV